MKKIFLVLGMFVLSVWQVRGSAQTFSVAASSHTVSRAAFPVELDLKGTEALVKNPGKFHGKLPESLIKVASNPRMKTDYKLLLTKVRAAGDTPQEKDLFVKSIRISAQVFDGVGSLYLEGAADTRGDSSYRLYIEFDPTTGKILRWDDVSFVDFD